MARYIDAEALTDSMLEHYNELCEKYGDYDHYTTGYGDAIDAIESAPTADVVPKNEVERLEHLRAELSKEVDRLKDDNKFLQDRRFKEWSEVRQEVAREIFAEIEEIAMHGVTPLGLCLMSMGEAAFAELKKKYTEGE